MELFYEITIGIGFALLAGLIIGVLFKEQPVPARPKRERISMSEVLVLGSLFVAIVLAFAIVILLAATHFLWAALVFVAMMALIIFSVRMALTYGSN